MQPDHAAAALCALLALVGPVLGGGEPDPHTTLVDPCELTDPRLDRLLRAEAKLVNAEALTRNDNGTWTLAVEPFTHLRDGVTPICADERHYGHPQVSQFNDRSAVLVGPDLVLSVPHGPNPPAGAACPDRAFVFGFQRRPGPGGVCLEPKTAALPAADVYRCRQVVANGWSEPGQPDLILYRLDRPVSGREPMRLRRDGQPEPGDGAALVSHPYALPAKVELGTYVVFGPGLRSFDGFHIAAGTSGAPLYDLETQLVEAAARGGCADCWFDVTSPETCARLGPRGVVSGDFTGNFASHVPPSELLVRPLQRVVHDGPPDGVDETSEYTLEVDPRAPAAVAFGVTLAEAASDEGASPQISFSFPDYPGGPPPRLAPGAALRLHVRAQGGPDPGFGSRSVVVTDRSHGWVDSLRHDFEIGYTEFEVTPTDGMQAEGLAPPFGPPAKYRLANRRLSPATVRVRALSDWLTLDGTAPPQPGGLVEKTVSLAPRGQVGDQADVEVGIGPLAETLRPGRYDSGVRFINVTGGPHDAGDTLRHVRLRARGKVWASSHPPIMFPSDPGEVQSQIEIPDRLCVGDLDLGLRHVFVARQMRLTVTGPDGTAVVLWDRQDLALPAEFDDEATPAPTGQLLSAFDGRRAAGLWTLLAEDLETPRLSILEGWSLDIVSGPCLLQAARGGPAR